LEQVLDKLRARLPRIVIVVATDVRDRLFLFDELRKRLPHVMLIDLEADSLVGHPDFLQASRGALSVSSVRLSAGRRLYGCEGWQDSETKSDDMRSRRYPISAWSTDFQAILADAISRLYDAEHEQNEQPCIQAQDPEVLQKLAKRQATLQVVTLEGFRRISSSFPSTTARKKRLSGRLLTFAEVCAPIFCIGAAWLWVGPLVLPRLRTNLRDRPWVAKANLVAAGICAVYGSGALALAYTLHRTDRDNFTYYWTAAILLVGSAGLFACVRRLRRASREAPPPSYWNSWIPASLALCATILAATPLWWHHLALKANEQYLDLSLLEKLALDPDPGLAFLLLVALATLALLYASAVLATSAGVVNRDSAVLRAAQSASIPATQPGPARLRENRGLLDIDPFGLLRVAGVLIAAMVLPDLLADDLRLTVFGPLASRVALLALTATTIAATLLACSSVGAARRITAMSRYLYAARSKSLDAVATWPVGAGTPRVFPLTPVLARAADSGCTARRSALADNPAEWSALLASWLRGETGSPHQAAVFALLVAEISLFRWSVAGAVLCALASVASVYLFPIGSDRLLLFNLLVLTAVGVATGFTATIFERDKLLSNVLCNRPEPRQFSTTLFVCITLPFLGLALAIAITDIPGVVDWGGGLLQLLGVLGARP
jgi:hypothetical protein